MRGTRKKPVALFGIALGFALGVMSRADDAHDQRVGPHGGAVEQTKHYQYEVICAADGLWIYPYGMDGKPLDSSKLKGTVAFYHPMKVSRGDRSVFVCCRSCIKTIQTNPDRYFGSNASNTADRSSR